MAVTVEHLAKRRHIQERDKRETFLSTADVVQTLEADPGQCPTNFHGMHELLRRIKLLDVLFRPRQGKVITFYPGGKR